MKEFLNHIRPPVQNIPIRKLLFTTFGVFLFGLIMGIFSKFLDCSPSNELPYVYELLDIRNFLGRFPIWLFLALLISVYSETPVWAGVRTFLFFTGMLISYYAYTNFIAGFFPVDYIMIWVRLTVCSPILAVLCWYAKGTGITSLMLSSGIIGILFTQAFNFDLTYFNVSNQGLEAILWFMAICIFCKNPKQLAQITGLSIIVAILWNTVHLFPF